MDPIVLKFDLGMGIRSLSRESVSHHWAWRLLQHLNPADIGSFSLLIGRLSVCQLLMLSWLLLLLQLIRTSQNQFFQNCVPKRGEERFTYRIGKVERGREKRAGGRKEKRNRKKKKKKVRKR